MITNSPIEAEVTLAIKDQVTDFVKNRSGKFYTPTAEAALIDYLVASVKMMSVVSIGQVKGSNVPAYEQLVDFVISYLPEEMRMAGSAISAIIGNAPEAEIKAKIYGGIKNDLNSETLLNRLRSDAAANRMSKEDAEKKAAELAGK